MKTYFENLFFLFINNFLKRNLFLTRDGNLKLGDLGLSRSLESGDTSMITTYAGTFKYMSPEMRNHGSYSYNSDIWLK